MNNKKEIIMLLSIIFLQSIIFIILGANKSYIHMDEAYSMGLTHYDKIEIQDNEDFYDNWHNGSYYNNYLTLHKNEILRFNPVYINQKNDVHPPFYYLLLRMFMMFSIGKFSTWPGITLNIIIFSFISIITYSIIKKIFKKPKISLILTFISCITVASLTNVIYIRMYALSTLNILITTYLHIKLYETDKLNVKLLLFIGLSALIGSLTHYYYLFYLVMLFIIFVIKYIKEKRIKEVIYYICTMALAGILSIVIFPYSINHMFFGYRGQGVISKLLNPKYFLSNIFIYIMIMDYYMFHCTFTITTIILLVLYKLKNIKIKTNNYIQLIILPTIFYFILVALSAPWTTLRYMLPISQLLFIIVIYYWLNVLSGIKNKANYIIGLILIIMLFMPIIFRIKPEVLYTNKKNIVNKVKTEYNVPTIYFLNMEDNRFLDDIYLFSLLGNSYITKDMNYSIEKIQKILNNKNLDNGILVVINSYQNNEEILKTLISTSLFKTFKHIEHLNNSDVYYLK